MRINTGSGIDPGLVDKLVELERRPVKAVEERKNKVVEEQKSFKELSGMISELGKTLSGMRLRTDFNKMKFESSHPDIIDGTVDNTGMVGSYEVELRSMARTHKLLAEGFPDKNETSVGFGYMTIELDNGDTFDIDIDPDASTLQDVARTINETDVGAKAVVINTKEYLETGEDSYRLLVISKTSGKMGKVYIDPDTTWMEYKEQVTGKNLELLFEDVPVFSEDNDIKDLLPGLVMHAKRAEPGTKVNINITYDVDKTMEQIKAFVDSYNKVNDFVDKQFQVDPQTNKAGILAKDNTLRSVRRSLQGALFYIGSSGKYRTLADVGIISDAKTGALKMDDTKVKQALSEDYDSVSRLFTQSETGEGLAYTLSTTVKNMQNSQGGFLNSKDREYKRLMQGFDGDIEKKERLASQRAENIKRKFSTLEGTISNLNAQGAAMQQRLAGG